jgi:hypothetical protein
VTRVASSPWTTVKASRREAWAPPVASSRNPFSGLGERGVQHFLFGMRVSARRYALGLGLCAALGCDQTEEPEELDPADVVVAERANTSLKATVNLAHVANIYHANDISNLPLTPTDVQELAVWFLNVSLEQVYQAFNCEPMIENGDSYVQATFVGCRTLFLELEGTARADITVEVDEANKPTGVNWRVDGREFSIHNPRQDFTPLFLGIVTLTTPINGGAMKWQTGPTAEHPDDNFEIDRPIGRFDARSIATWTIDDNECVTMDLDAQLTQLDMEDDLDEEIGDIVVSVKDLRQCQDRCPEDGTVNLAYGAGRILEWTYTAESVVDINGPGGTAFEGVLPCGD